MKKRLKLRGRDYNSRLFWSKTVRRTQKQKPTEKSSVCLSASEFAELPSTPVFASRAEILSQIQLCRRLYRGSCPLITLSFPYIKIYKFWYRYKEKSADPDGLQTAGLALFLYILFKTVLRSPPCNPPFTLSTHVYYSFVKSSTLPSPKYAAPSRALPWSFPKPSQSTAANAR